ncbi:Protein AEXR-3 [Aphelenchoides avenae]|nr:Protein AEXR-3 [Aphelenchus avenae]
MSTATTTLEAERYAEAALEETEPCSNSHIISINTIIAFTENTDGIIFVCSVLSSLFQVYVMCIATKQIRNKSNDKCTEKCMPIFLLSMTAADFLLTGLCYPIELAPRAGLLPKFPRYVSAAMHILCWIALIVSSISLVFLNIDKLYYFRFPLRYTTMFTQKRAVISVVICWLLSSLFVMFAWLTESFRCVDEDCITLAIFPNRLHVYVPFMVFVGVIPSLTSLIVAIYIMRIVAAHRRNMAEERRLLCPTGGVHRSGSTSGFAARLRTFYFVFMTTVFTAVTLLPYRLFGLQRALNPGGVHDCATVLFLWILMYLVYLHSIINPLLTVTILPQYRIRIAHTFFKPRKEVFVNTATPASTDL